MDLPTEDEINVLGHLSGLHNDWQLVVFLCVFVNLVSLVIFILVKSELAVVKDLSGELLLAVFEDKLEYFIVHLEYLIDYFVFQSWFQLVEYLRVFDHHCIKLVPVIIKTLYSLQDLIWHKFVFPGFIKGYQPVI